MQPQNKFKKSLRRACISLLSVSLMHSSVLANVVSIPPNTKIYIETDEPIIGKKKYTQAGQVVRANIWRDVVVDGQTVIEAGSSVLVRVDTLKGGRIAGRKGKMTLGAYDTTAIDGTIVDLGGGYFKEGTGRIALSATLAAVVFLPLIFIKGKSAELPRGTIFDAYTKRRTDISIDGISARPTRSINLANIGYSQMEVETLYDELETTDKPENFVFSINIPTGNSGVFSIDVINDETIDEPLELASEQTARESDVENWRGQIKIKKLAKKFKKGINTFEIATEIDGQRVGAQVVLDIQF